MLSVLPPSGQNGGPRPQDFQRISELLNKFVINTAHLMNAFCATCETRLNRAARALQRIEVQTALLEYKLDSIDQQPDDDGAPKGKTADSTGQRALTTASNGGGTRGARGNINLPVPQGAASVPPMPNRGRGAAPPPVPHSGGPPAPPAALSLPPPPPPIAPGAPPLIGTPPPPPPMPTAAGLTVRTHPRLAGYFKMAQAGVAVAAIKAKMRADGHNPDWFDNPNMPSPLPAVRGRGPQTTNDLLDSD